jgi:hypothetical protein
MKRILVLVALLAGLTTTVAAAQTRVGVSLRFGNPYYSGEVIVGHPYRPYYHRYWYPRYYRDYYFGPRVFVIRPRRFHERRYHRHW